MNRSRSTHRVFSARYAVVLALFAACLAMPAQAWLYQVKGNGDGATLAVTVDSAGNAIAAGAVVRTAGLYLTVVKLSGNTGAELWHSEITGTDNAGVAYGVAVNNAGDVFVAGGLGNAGTSLDFTVIRFDGSTGAEIWRGVIANTGDEAAFAIALDSAGNVVAAGSTNNGSGGKPLTVVKLDGATGAELWRYMVSGAGTYGTGHAHVTVDHAGDVVAAGATWLTPNSPGTSYDFTVVKLSGVDGSQQWLQLVDGPDHGEDQARALAVDSDGDVIAVGELGTMPNRKMAAFKFSGATGAEQWRRLYSAGGQDNEAYAVASDAAKNAYIAGSLGDQFIVLRVDSAGNEQWRQDGIGTSAYLGTAYGLRLDSTGAVVAGGVLGPQYDFGVVKLNAASGAEEWHAGIDGSFVATSGSDGDGVIDLVLDASDNTIAGGILGRKGPSGLVRDFTVSKFDATGSVGAMQAAQESCDNARARAWDHFTQCVDSLHFPQASWPPTSAAADLMDAGLAQCRHTYFSNWAAFQKDQTFQGSTCSGPRYSDNFDGTVTDNLTEFVWEQKRSANGTQNPADRHDADNKYSMSLDSSNGDDGSVFTDFLSSVSTDFLGGTSEWRLPTLAELETTVMDYPCTGDPRSPACTCVSSPCIDPVFGPMSPSNPIFYETSTTGENDPSADLEVSYLDMGGTVTHAPRTGSDYARAVGGGLSCSEARLKAWYAYSECVNKYIVQEESSGLPISDIVSTDMQRGLAKCRQKYVSQWPLSDSAGSACSGDRFADNLDGTVSDKLTGLVWEKKTGSIADLGCVPPNCTDLHGVKDFFNYSAVSSPVGIPNGNLFTVFLNSLNGANFGGSSGWRLPTLAELMTVVADHFPPCDAWLCQCPSSPGPCVESGFSSATQTLDYLYVTSTVAFMGDSRYRWVVNFDSLHGDVRVHPENVASAWSVRAVRGGFGS